MMTYKANVSSLVTEDLCFVMSFKYGTVPDFEYNVCISQMLNLEIVQVFTQGNFHKQRAQCISILFSLWQN